MEKGCPYGYLDEEYSRGIWASQILFNQKGELHVVRKGEVDLDGGEKVQVPALTYNITDWVQGKHLEIIDKLKKAGLRKTAELLLKESRLRKW